MKYAPPLDATDPNASYVDANPGAGIQGSVVGAAAIEPGMREIVQVINEAGLTPSADDNTQLAQAINIKIANKASSVNLSDTGATTGVLPISRGGTGRTTLNYPLGLLVAGEDGTFIGNLDNSAALAGQPLLMTASHYPGFGVLSLSNGNAVTGILPVNKGGTGVSNAKVVTTTSDANSVWYRIYSDGWVEQGGLLSLNGETGTITLPVALGFSAAYIQLTRHVGAGAHYAPVVTTGSTTYIRWGAAYGAAGQSLSWECKGWRA